MGLDGFERLYHDADARTEPVSVAVAGGDDPTVLEAMRIACDRGWVQPILVGPERGIRALAACQRDRPRRLRRSATPRATRSPRRPWPWSGPATRQALMKGQIATPELMKAVLDHDTGLRTGRVICQVVLMEIPRDRPAVPPGRYGHLRAAEPGRADRHPPQHGRGRAMPCGRRRPKSRSWRRPRPSSRRCPRPSRPPSSRAATGRASSATA